MQNNIGGQEQYDYVALSRNEYNELLQRIDELSKTVATMHEQSDNSAQRLRRLAGEVSSHITCAKAHLKQSEDFLDVISGAGR